MLLCSKSIYEMFCVAKEMPIRLEKTKLQTAIVIFFVVLRFACVIVIGHYRIDLSESSQTVHGFLTCTVKHQPYAPSGVQRLDDDSKTPKF